jgi:Abortive infection C-terminus
MQRAEGHKLPKESIAVFGEIFQIAQKEAKGVDSIKYRASNPRYMKTLDRLLTDGLLVIEDSRWYRPSLAGLHYLSQARARGVNELLRRCQRVFFSLKVFYRESPSEKIELGELSKRTKLPLDRLSGCLAYLRGQPWLGGRSSELRQAEDYIVPNENILNYRSFQEALRQAVKFNWTSTRPTTLSGGMSNLFQNQVTIAVGRLGNGTVSELWEKALVRCEGDPSGAITAARSLLESTCKLILDERKIKYTRSASLPELFTQITTEMEISPTQQSTESFRKITGGCKTIVDSLSAIRNELGDSHGKGNLAVRPAPRHAELAVNLAGAVSKFLVQTSEGRRKP